MIANLRKFMFGFGSKSKEIESLNNYILFLESALVNSQDQIVDMEAMVKLLESERDFNRQMLAQAITQINDLKNECDGLMFENGSLLDKLNNLASAELSKVSPKKSKPKKKTKKKEK